MNISKYIQAKKDQFRDAQSKKKERLALQEAERLRLERHRQGELAKAQAEKVRLEKDVQRISAFTEKHKDMSKMEKFGKGVASVINKGRETIKKSQHRHKAKGSIFRAVPSSGSKGLDTVKQGSPFGGQRNLDVGGGKSSGGYTFGPTPKAMPEKKKGTTTTIKTQ